MKKFTYKTLLAPALLLLLFLTAGCRSGDVASFGTAGTGFFGGGGTPVGVTVQLSSSSISNGGSTTVTATVKDVSGTAVADYIVSFSVISAVTGTFSQVTGVSDSFGRASTTFTAYSPAGNDSRVTIQATVTVNSVAINGSAQLTIGTPPLAPGSVAVSLGSSTIGNGLSTSVTATVRDATATLIGGATVTFSVAPNSGAGNFSPSATATTGVCPGFDCGVATVTFIAATPAGDNSLQNITATAGPASRFAQLTIGTPAPPAPSSASITVSPLSINIQNQATVSVTVMGAGGTPAYNTAVSLSITSGQNLASFSTSTLVSSVTVTTNASGIASAPIYSGSSSGTVTVQATVGSVTPVSASFNITSAPASMTINVVNSNLVVGGNTNITATVRNVMGNPVDNGTPVNFAITSSSPPGSLSASSATTINGDASVTFNATAAGSAIVQALVSSPTTTITQQAIIVVNAAQAGSLQYVSVNPTTGVIPIGGGAATLTFKVLDVNGKPLKGQTVTFQKAVAPSDAVLDPSSNVTALDGTVITTLRSNSMAGPVRVVANATVQGTTTVLYASSGALSIGGGVPSYKWFSLSVEKFNIPGLNCDNVTDTVYVNMADRFGNYNILQGTAVSFQTAYGAINTSNITNDKGQTQSVFRSQDPRPGDGQVRILVTTTGEETFNDMNGDGVYTAGTDSFIPANDLPEPFIDENHNGVWDSGEQYFNWLSTVLGATPAYNNANGEWDPNIPIWRMVDIWLTGPPTIVKTDGTPSSRIECTTDTLSSNPTTTTGNITITKGNFARCFVFGSDINGNALIGGTKVSLTSDKTDATVTWASGVETYADHKVNGPEITGYKVTNKTSSTTSVDVNLSATIDWPGTCGAMKLIISYPGQVTLSP